MQIINMTGDESEWIPNISIVCTDATMVKEYQLVSVEAVCRIGTLSVVGAIGRIC